MRFFERLRDTKIGYENHEICKKCGRKFIPFDSLPFLIAIKTKPKKRIVSRYGKEIQITTSNSDGEAVIEMLNFPTNPYKLKKINCHENEIIGFAHKSIKINDKVIELDNEFLAKGFMEFRVSERF